MTQRDGGTGNKIRVGLNVGTMEYLLSDTVKTDGNAITEASLYN